MNEIRKEQDMTVNERQVQGLVKDIAEKLSDMIYFGFDRTLLNKDRDKFYRQVLLIQALNLANMGKLEEIKTNTTLERMAVQSATPIDLIYDIAAYLHDNFGKI